MTMHPSLARSLQPQRQAQNSGSARYAEIPHDQKDTLLSYFLSLNDRERCIRFGLAASDDYIRSYLAGVDWRYYCAFADRQDGGILALVELVGDRQSGWRRPELAISLAGTHDTGQVRAELLQIAFFAAHARGAAEIVIYYEPAEEWVLALAAEFGGTLDSVQGVAVLPIGDDPGACRPHADQALGPDWAPTSRCLR